MKFINSYRDFQFSFIVLVLLASIVGCSQSNFQRNEAGLKYYLVHHNTEKEKPKIGDVLDIHVRYYVDDSLSFDNRFYLSLDSARHNNGSIETGLAMLHVGDSAIFKLAAKPFYEYSLKRQYPEAFDKDSKLRFEVRLFGFKTKAEIKREREAIFNRTRMEEEKEIAAYIKEHSIKTESPSGLYITQLNGGTGKIVEPGKKVTVHYTGAFLTGQVFDSSVHRNEPFSFIFGTGEVITAWEMGLKDSRVGDKIQIITPSWYAYQEKGVEGIIPPNTPLHFEIEILETE